MKRFLLTAYHCSPGEFWLAGILILRGLWFALPGDSLANPAYAGLLSLAYRVGARGYVEEWWGAVHIALGLSCWLALSRGWGRGRIVVSAFSAGLWGLFFSLFFQADPMIAALPLYSGFIAAHLWICTQLDWRRHDK